MTDVRVPRAGECAARGRFGGEVVVSSTVGEGSTFTARFKPLRWVG